MTRLVMAGRRRGRGPWEIRLDPAWAAGRTKEETMKTYPAHEAAAIGVRLLRYAAWACEFTITEISRLTKTPVAQAREFVEALAAEGIMERVGGRRWGLSETGRRLMGVR